MMMFLIELKWKNFFWAHWSRNRWYWYFENKDFDVVKFNVKKSYILQELHDELSTIQNKFKDFTPHITIAYVKKEPVKST
jgi:2'-5' RNA ligase